MLLVQLNIVNIVDVQSCAFFQGTIREAVHGNGTNMVSGISRNGDSVDCHVVFVYDIQFSPRRLHRHIVPQHQTSSSSATTSPL